MTTKTFTISSAGYTAITTRGQCTEVVLSEDNMGSTSDILLRAPFSNSDIVTKPGGVPIVFGTSKDNPYPPNTVLGYISCVSSSFTMAQEEKN